MKSVIKILDEVTANKIAAGEVVERPSSCVKELVENSIDAGSREIEVEIANGGTEYMRVTDDGIGMSPEDAKLALVRHGTSKIRSVEDIFHITSLGFRGEAIPSIAAVSKFKMTTRQADEPFAVYLEVNGGELAAEEEVGANVGTTIEVLDLFYNTPARKKFMKSERTEGGKISEILTKLAMANPHIGFRLIHNGRTTLHTAGNGKLLDAVASLYGNDVAKDLFPIAYEEDGIEIEGFIGKPSLLKSTRQWQTCIVNQRVITSRVVYKAIDNAYHAMLPKGGYPAAVIVIKLAPDTLDVNVHPQKMEIKFSDEQRIYRCVYRAIVNSLVQKEEAEQVATDIVLTQEEVQKHAYALPETQPDITAVKEEVREPGAAYGERTVVSPALGNLPEMGSFSISEPPERREERETLHWKYEDRETPAYHAAVPAEILQKNESIFTRVEEEEPETLFLDKIEFEDDTVLYPMGQVADCYIVAKKGQDLYIIDQHAAHERIRYDRFCLRTERIPAQALLMAEFITVDPDDTELLEREKDVFYDLGFQYEWAGEQVIRVEEIPADMESAQVADAIRVICTSLHEEHRPSKAELRHRVLAYASCRGAVKAGDRLNMYQMKALLEELLHTEKPFVCPHGRPVIVRFTPEELGKLFHRT